MKIFPAAMINLNALIYDSHNRFGIIARIQEPKYLNLNIHF